VLLFACLILAAHCLPKHHISQHKTVIENTHHKTKSLERVSIPVEENLDEEEDVVDAELEESDEAEEPEQEEEEEVSAEEPDQEEDEVSADEADAEEEESDNAEPEQEEDDAEDSDAVADADDNLAEVDAEEDEEMDAKQSKIAADIQRVSRALEESDLPANARKDASADLNKIASDVRELRHATPTRAKALKEAIKLRMKAFRLMTQESAPAKHQELEEEDALVKVGMDVAALEKAVKHSSMSRKDKQLAEKNLESIKEDAVAFHSATEAKVKTLYKKALAKRMQALKGMLH
jgi:hypothetical protein